MQRNQLIRFDRSARSSLPAAVGAVAAAVVVCGGLLIATASVVGAPEPAHLNGSLHGNGSAASATYVTSKASTRAYQWTGSWAAGSAPAGAPCSTTAVAAGAMLMSVIQASGSYRKCS